MDLTIYDFHKIASDFEALLITNYHVDKNWNCPPGGVCCRFHWEWHRYSGSGMICLMGNTLDGKNEFCKQSYMQIHRDSIRQAKGKHISEVYNEPALVEVLQYIADCNRIFDSQN